MAAVGGLSGDRRRCTDRRKMSTVGAFGNGRKTNIAAPWVMVVLYSILLYGDPQFHLGGQRKLSNTVR